MVVQRDRHLEGALGLAEEQRGVVAVRVADGVQAALRGAAGPAVVGDDEVGQRAALAFQAVQDGGHRGRGVGVPERRAALLDGDVRELEDHAFVGHQPARDAYDLAAGRPQRLRGLAVDVEQAAGVAGGEEDPFGALDGLAEPGGGPVQGVDGQLRVDGVLPEPVLRIVADPAPLGHHGQHVLLVAPPVAQLQAQPVVPVPVGQAAVVGQVVVARRGDVPAMRVRTRCSTRAARLGIGMGPLCRGACAASRRSGGRMLSDRSPARDLVLSASPGPPREMGIDH